MFHDVGREILSGPRWPLGTASYKAERRKRGGPGKKSAGLIVPHVSPRKLGEREGALLQSWDSTEVGMSDCHTARNGVDKVRNLQRALYRKSKQEKEARFYSVYDKVW